MLKLCKMVRKLSTSNKSNILSCRFCTKALGQGLLFRAHKCQRESFSVHDEESDIEKKN